MSIIVKGMFRSDGNLSCPFRIEASTPNEMLLILDDEHTVVVDLVRLREEKLAAFDYWVYLAEQVLDFRVAHANVRFVLEDGSFGMPKIMITDTQIPSKVRMAMNYAAAIYKWKKAGKPERSNSEVNRIHSQVCTPCPYYRHASSTCGKCGCSVNSKTNALNNKIVMETENCPVGRW